VKVLFVCLGNICRSPAAQGVFEKYVDEADLKGDFLVDSAGTAAYHVGEMADGRMIQHANERGYDLTSVARRFASSDLDDFDLILTMDNSNYENVLKLAKTDIQKDRVKKMTDFCRVHEIEEVPDPYHEGDEGFRLVLDILEDSCSELLKSIQSQEPKDAETK